MAIRRGVYYCVARVTCLVLLKYAIISGIVIISSSQLL